jgi:hypothetical protein
MAACGQGRDADDLDEKSRVNLRRQALDWLLAELEAQDRLLEQKPEKASTVAGDLQDWLWDSHFAGGYAGRTRWPGCPSPNGQRGSSCGPMSRTHGPGPKEGLLRDRTPAAS